MMCLAFKYGQCYRWCLEKAMATHSSTLAWKIPWTEEPGGLKSMGSRLSDSLSLSLSTLMHWRRKRQPTPVFLPGESQGRRSPVGCRLWGCTVGHNWSDLTVTVKNKWSPNKVTWKRYVLPDLKMWALPFSVKITLRKISAFSWVGQ